MGKENGLTYSCDQHWEQLRPVAGGRYCDSCSKPVKDFTAWDRETMLHYLDSHPGTCGYFTIEQLHPELRPLPALPAGALKGALAALTALALNTSSAQQSSPDVTPSEQAPVMGGEKPTPIAPILEEPEEKCWMEKEPRTSERAAPHRYRWYTSKRFPFLHKRRPRLLGF